MGRYSWAPCFFCLFMTLSISKYLEHTQNPSTYNHSWRLIACNCHCSSFCTSISMAEPGLGEDCSPAPDLGSLGSAVLILLERFCLRLENLSSRPEQLLQTYPSGNLAVSTSQFCSATTATKTDSERCIPIAESRLLLFFCSPLDISSPQL